MHFINSAAKNILIDMKELKKVKKGSRLTGDVRILLILYLFSYLCSNTESDTDSVSFYHIDIIKM